jgi:hypothetical protein
MIFSLDPTLNTSPKPHLHKMLPCRYHVILGIWNPVWNGKSQLPSSQQLRVTSHYGQRSRGHWFPPIILQETKNLASRPFTLEAKVQSPSLSKISTWQYFLTKAMDFRRKSESAMNKNPNYGQEVVDYFLYFFFAKTNKILVVRLEGLYWTWNKVGCSFFLWTLGLSFNGFTLWPSKPRGHGQRFGLWRLHTMPDRRLWFL